MTDPPPPPPPPDPPASPPVARAEWWLVAMLLATGLLLRCWQPSHMAVEHFDEGVYASNLYSPDGSFPYRHLYAPPLLPALLEWALILSGGAAGAVMALNVLAGTLLVPSVWWVGRQWFGPVAGLSAAALACFSDIHILYSRTALTDGLLCLWLLWAVYWTWQAILDGTPVAILLAGLFACLAWWTKYNGWLALAISGSGLFAWLLVDRSTGFQTLPEAGRSSTHGLETRATLRSLLRWLAVAAIAFGGWLPYLLSLSDRGGYASVAANHARYFVGLTGWWEGLLRQAANLQHIESWWSALGQLAALVLTVIAWRLNAHLPNETNVPPRQQRWIIVGINAGAVAVLAIALSAGLTAVLVALSLVGLAGALRRLMTAREQNPARRLAVWMLTAWLIGLLVAVPLYHPYPRLTLPLVVACWLGSGQALSLLHPRWLGLTPRPDRRREFATARQLVGIGVAMIVVFAGALAWQSERQDADLPVAWEDRRGLQQIAAEVLAELPSTGDQLIYVLGEPGLYFHLAFQSDSPRRAILPGSDLASLHLEPEALQRVAVYVLAGPNAGQLQPDPQAGVTWAESHARPLRQWPWRPSTLVRLNQSPPAQLDELADQEIRLLRIAK
jgi:dolichyl-phosphate-mannose-protein mannosyltransferase